MPSLFLVLGGTYAAVQLLGVLLMVDPPQSFQEDTMEVMIIVIMMMTITTATSSSSSAVDSRAGQIFSPVNATKPAVR